MPPTQIRFLNEGLNNYIADATPPPAAPAPALDPRLPVQPPNGNIPGGFRPIPTSSQGPKKTNVQIPYARQASTDVGTCGVAALPVEGEIVFTERTQHYKNKTKMSGVHALIKVLTVEQINRRLAKEGSRNELYDMESFPYSLDGVINNVDTADPMNEFKDHAIANVAIQGHVRLDHQEARRCCMKKTLPGTHLYVGLVATRADDGEGYTHKLERFSGLMIANKAYDPLFQGTRKFMSAAWHLGTVTDSHQSQNMIGIHVRVDPLRYERVPDFEKLAQVETMTGYARVKKVYMPRSVLLLGLRLILHWRQVPVAEPEADNDNPDNNRIALCVRAVFKAYAAGEDLVDEMRLDYEAMLNHWDRPDFRIDDPRGHEE